MAVGLNWYLKYYCHCNVSINGRQLNLPRSLPAVEKKFRLLRSEGVSFQNGKLANAGLLFDFKR